MPNQLLTLGLGFGALICLQGANAPAGTIHVPKEQPTIQQAINAASAGDVVLVAPGKYFEHLDFKGKAITLQGARGAGRTIIDGGYTDTVVMFQSREGPQSVLAGFTIQHGSASFGAGVSLRGASPTIMDNVFRYNTQLAGGFGAAIGANGSSAVIRRNRFVANTADNQFPAGVVSFVNTSSPVIVNNIFEHNPCRAINMTLPEGSNPTVAHNTIVHNRVGVRVDENVPAIGHYYFNNIIVDNDLGLEADWRSVGDDPTWEHNLVYGNKTNYSGVPKQTGLNGNIAIDPMFENSDGLDFRLQSASPAIDAGTASWPRLPKSDFVRHRRNVDGDGDGEALPDMGAFEFIP